MSLHAPSGTAGFTPRSDRLPMMETVSGDDEAMRTTCPTCDTVYVVPDDRIGPKGRKVRCARCDEEWRVRLEPVVDADADAAPAVRADHPDVPPFEEPSEPPPTEDDVDPFAAAPGDDPEPAADVTDETAMGEDPPPPVADTAGPARPAPSMPAGPRPAARRGRFATPRLPRRLLRLAPLAGPAVFVLACALLTCVVVFRTAVVSHMPALAGLYRLVGLEVNLRGIVFGQIETLRETEDGKPVLVVEGSLANTTGSTHDVPALRFALRDADAQELYAWSIDPRASVIPAGDSLRFRTRLVAPPDRAVDLQVRFAERRNRQAVLP